MLLLLRVRAFIPLTGPCLVVRTVHFNFFELCLPLSVQIGLRINYFLKVSARLKVSAWKGTHSYPVHQHLWLVLRNFDLRYGSEICGLYSPDHLLFSSSHTWHFGEPLISATRLLLIITLLTSVRTPQHTGVQDNRCKCPAYKGRWCLFLQRWHVKQQGGRLVWITRDESFRHMKRCDISTQRNIIEI